MLNIETSSVFTIKLAALLLGLQFLIKIPQGLLHGIYQSIGEYPRGIMLSNLQTIFLIILTACILTLRKGFIWMAAIQVIPIFTFVIIVLIDIRKRHPEICFRFNAVSWRYALSFLVPSSFFFLITLSLALEIQGSLLIISSMLGTAYVSIFVVHRTLINIVKQTFGMMKNAIWPEFTAIEARNDYSSLQSAHDSVVKLSLFISSSFAVFLYFTGGTIIRLWTADRIPFNSRLWCLFIISLPISAVWNSSGLVQLATNQHKKYSILQFSAAIVGIILAIGLTKMFNIVGTLSGFVIAEGLVCGYFIPRESLRILKKNACKFWVEVIGKGLVVAFIQGFTGWFVFQNISNIYIQWVLLMVSISISGCLTGYFFWLTAEEKMKVTAIKKSLVVLIYQKIAILKIKNEKCS